MELIDIHSHILAGVDDGAENREMMRRMLKIAWEDGIHTVFATPHYHPHRGHASREQWKLALDTARLEAALISPSMRVVEGCEILYRQNTAGLLQEERVCPLGKSRYVLVEFPENAEFSYMLRGLQDLRNEGWLPVLAHVERYVHVRKVEQAERLVGAGAYLQMNADAVLKGQHWRQGAVVRKLLTSGCIHFIGTDAHDDRIRPPKLRAAYRYIEKLCGADCAGRLCGENAKKILTREIL